MYKLSDVARTRDLNARRGRHESVIARPGPWRRGIPVEVPSSLQSGPVRDGISHTRTHAHTYTRHIQDTLYALMHKYTHDRHTLSQMYTHTRADIRT